jgi:DNA-binding transcriptional regulator YiaG
MPPAAWTPEAIRALRKRLGLVQDDFAALVCTRQTVVSRWEAGAAHPLRAFCRKLDLLAAEGAR